MANEVQKFSKAIESARRMLLLGLHLAAAPLAAQSGSTDTASAARRAEFIRALEAGRGPDAQLNDSLASIIVTRAAQVEPDETVLISGNALMSGLLEALEYAVHAAGGRPIVQLLNERAYLMAVFSLPESHLLRLARYSPLDSALALDVDVTLSVSGNEVNYAEAFSVLPPDRLEILQSGGPTIDSLLVHAKARHIDFWIPGPGDAAATGKDLEAFRAEIRRAASVDPVELEMTAKALADRVARARHVRITTSGGTAITLAVDSATRLVNAGVLSRIMASERVPTARYASLPSGTLSFAVQSGTGVGNVRRASEWCRDIVRDASFDLAAGAARNLTAASGAACLTEFLGKAGALSGLIIGLNPERVPAVRDGVTLPSGAQSGAVTLHFGNNLYLGGTNAAPIGWQFGLGLATLELDGEVVMQGGRFLLDEVR